jgi:hypothetical protein
MGATSGKAKGHVKVLVQVMVAYQARDMTHRPYHPSAADPPADTAMVWVFLMRWI